MVFTKVTKKQELVGPVGSGKVLLAARVAEGQKLDTYTFDIYRIKWQFVSNAV